MDVKGDSMGTCKDIGQHGVGPTSCLVFLSQLLGIGPFTACQQEELLNAI